MCKVSWSQVSTLIAARPNCKKATSSRKLISNQSRHLQITIKWLHRLIPVKLKSYRFADTGCVHFSFCGRGNRILLRLVRDGGLAVESGGSSSSRGETLAGGRRFACHFVGKQDAGFVIGGNSVAFCHGTAIHGRIFQKLESARHRPGGDGRSYIGHCDRSSQSICFLRWARARRRFQNG